ncbi:hypothetical protein Anapl_08118 [Anas platyrhynchos]|uniref:Uncharacterized protein n=1 Tax=Anas platyrhynchos TaxID=8839 RepID=R0KFI9_ANAPL|nr:hypothetical protein Anapl_08118 [Anas platyrhynchos]
MNDLQAIGTGSPRKNGEEEERFGSLDILYEVSFQCLSVMLLSKLDSSQRFLPETKREVTDWTSVCRGKSVTYRQKASGLHPEERALHGN